MLYSKEELEYSLLEVLVWSSGTSQLIHQTACSTGHLLDRVALYQYGAVGHSTQSLVRTQHWEYVVACVSGILLLGDSPAVSSASR